jgi:hypothetical protein
LITHLIILTLDSRETTKEPQYLPGASVVMETIEERLSPKIPEESLSYGPMPPTSHGLKLSYDIGFVYRRTDGHGETSIPPYNFVARGIISQTYHVKWEALDQNLMILLVHHHLIDN